MSLKSTTSPDSLAPTSPFSNHSNLSTSSISNNSTNASPNFNSSYIKKEKKSAQKHQTQLSTSSPAGIVIASKVTPERLAHLLLKTGPLAIRHITSNLAKQIQGFEKLSLSKQRRLIMSCLDQGYQDESIIFEKIGWGQWSAKKVEPENFIKERNAVRIANAKVKDGDHHNTSGGGSNATSSNVAAAAAASRRESITRNKYEVDQHEKFLKKHSNSTSKIGGDQRTTNAMAVDDDFAIASDDEDDEDLENAVDSTSDFYDEEDDRDGDDDDDNVFKFDDEEHIPPLKLNSRLVSPPFQPGSTPSRTSARSSFSRGISKPKFKSVRSNSQTPTSPELLYYQRIENSTKNSTSINRRHSSIRSTLTHDQIDQDSDTDEEDWQSIGALKLRKNSIAPPEITIPNLPKEEQDAAVALVNLRSI